jgi:hypothetical protein
MAASNLASLIILLLLPLICIVILVPIMFFYSKLFSLLISRFKLQEIKSIHIAGSIGSIIFFLLSIGMYLLHNYEYQKPLFHFSSWQILSIILFTIIGSGITYEYKNKFLKKKLFALAATILLSIIMALHGVDVIKTEEVYVKYVHFQGGEAIYIGIVYIVWAILLILLAAYLYKERRNHNKSNTTDRLRSG